MTNLRVFIIVFAISFVFVSAIDSLKQTPGAGKKYGGFLLSYALSNTNYLLVSEGGTNLGVDIYTVTSSARTKLKTHTNLATTSYGYKGFAQDGTNLFVIGDYTYVSSSNYNFKIHAYPLSSLSGSSVSVSTPFTLSSGSYDPVITATYSSTPSAIGYVALGGGNKVSVCKYNTPTTSITTCAATTWTLSWGSSSYFGDRIAFAPGTTILAVSDTSTGSSSGSIYLYDVSSTAVSSSTAPTAFKTFSSSTQNNYFGGLIAMSATTLYAYGDSPDAVYSYSISGASTSPTSVSSVTSSSRYSGHMVLSVDGGTLAMSNYGDRLTTLSVSPLDGTIISKNTIKTVVGANQASSLAATPDFVFASSTTYNSNDGEVFVFANDVAPTAAPTPAPTPYFMWYYMYSSSDCSGSPFGWYIATTSELGAAFGAVLFKSCYKFSTLGYIIGSAGKSAPDLPIGNGGVLTTYYNSASDCAAGNSQWDRKLFLYFGVCMGPFSGSYAIINSCDASTEYSDSTCSTQGISTSPPLSTTCPSVPDSDGHYSVVSCVTPAPPAKPPNNDLAIGLGVGLGGGAAMGAGAGVFYYVKGLHAAAHKVAVIAEPVADSIELA